MGRKRHTPGEIIGKLRVYEGLQVHRSHWIARAGVDRLVTDDKRLFVHLKNGVKLPVSRPNYAAVKAAFADEAVEGVAAAEA